MSTTSYQDHETRQRLLDAAAKLFAEKGLKNITVRDICNDAGANLAAVNYYFRDKLGLYRQVVELAADAMNLSKVNVLEAAESLPPEERLRAYIRLTLHNLLDSEEQSWMERLIAREMLDPTDALDLIIEKGIKPTAERNGRMIAELLGLPLSDDRVWKCFLSVQAQCLFYKTAKPITARMSPDGFRCSPEIVDQLADHIAEFSLAGIRAIAQQKQEVKS